jgi:undecaprenyl-diphosphatase
MLKNILEFDERLFFFINQINEPVLNTFFEIVSSKYFFLIPVLFFVYFQNLNRILFFKRFLFFIITIGFVDYTIYHIFKPLFKRLRPCHALELVFPNKLLGNCGGQFSFFSNHAGNSFAFVFCLILVFELNQNFRVLLLVWAILVCFSRVYVGVHYPLDVFFGATYGFLISKLFFNIYNKQILKL